MTYIDALVINTLDVLELMQQNLCTDYTTQRA